MTLSLRLNSGSRPVSPNVKPLSRLAVPWNDLGFVGDHALLWAPSKFLFGITRLDDGALGSNPETMALGASLPTALDILNNFRSWAPPFVSTGEILEFVLVTWDTLAPSVYEQQRVAGRVLKYNFEESTVRAETYKKMI